MDTRLLMTLELAVVGAQKMGSPMPTARSPVGAARQHLAGEPLAFERASGRKREARAGEDAARCGFAG